jgi:hypothetical protein
MPTSAFVPPQTSTYTSQPQAYYLSGAEQSYGAPQIMNPFPLPGQAGASKNGYDPEVEAQIAQWQSAYVTKDDGVAKSAVPVKSKDGSTGGRTGTSTPVSGIESHAHSHSDSNAAAADKPQTVVRHGGGKQWEDSSLLEWDPAHFRIFIGNLAGEVTDDSLLKAFSKYSSVQKARVVRDKRTTKSKGFGFVSFSDGDDYFKAAKEMEGKYIGSHPVSIRRAVSDVRPVAVKGNDKNKKGKHKGGMKGLHANTGAGVQKNQKDKGGLRFLG